MEKLGVHAEALDSSCTKLKLWIPIQNLKVVFFYFEVFVFCVFTKLFDYFGTPDFSKVVLEAGKWVVIKIGDVAMFDGII